MADKYGYIDARYYSFECSLDGIDVSTYCERGNDLDGWVDLYPLDTEGHIITVDTVRHRGEVTFSRVIADRQSLSILSIDENRLLRDRIGRLESDLEELRLQVVKQTEVTVSRSRW